MSPSRLRAIRHRPYRSAGINKPASGRAAAAGRRVALSRPYRQRDRFVARSASAGISSAAQQRAVLDDEQIRSCGSPARAGRRVRHVQAASTASTPRVGVCAPVPPSTGTSASLDRGCPDRRSGAVDRAGQTTDERAPPLRARLVFGEHSGRPVQAPRSAATQEAAVLDPPGCGSGASSPARTPARAPSAHRRGSPPRPPWC